MHVEADRRPVRLLLAASEPRGGHLSATSIADAHAMRLTRRTAKDASSMRPRGWARPWPAHPVAVALFFSGHGDDLGTRVRGFDPEQRDTW